MIRRWLALGLVGGVWWARASAADATVPASVRVEVQMVSVSVAEARLLVPGLQEARTAQRTFDRVQEMLTQDKAVLLGWPMVWLRCGPSAPPDAKHAICETILEFRYPTEFDPPQEPGIFLSGGGIHWGASTPTAFETRNTLVTLEVDAAVEDNGRIIRLGLMPQFVRFLNCREYRTPASPLGVYGLIKQPIFATAKAAMQHRVVHDRPTLLGAFVMGAPKPHVELFILRARVTVLPPEAGTAVQEVPPL